MEIAGYLASALIGISLGLIGGGGSILTVPVLVYLFSISPGLATSYSLFIVGSSSLVGALNNYKEGWVSIKTALLFGTTSVTTVFFTRKIIMPAIPELITRMGPILLTKRMLIMVLFAILMLIASVSMIKNKGIHEEDTLSDSKIHLSGLLLNGLFVGLVTGFLGAGGGFLLIPALVIMVKLPMKEAIGTSLLIIAFNSLVGFSGDLGHVDLDWTLLLKITFLAIVGIFIGGAIGKRIPGEKLKRGFGWFVLLMGIYILVKEFSLGYQ